MAQCGNCHFENLPGQTNCGRCGSSLTLRTAVIDVHPPRAGAWAKRLRRLPAARWRYRLLDAWFEFARRAGLEPEAGSESWQIAFRRVVPGWPQLYTGHTVLGGALLTAFLVNLFLAGMFVGTAGGSVFLGLVFACHAASIYDVARSSTETQGVPWWRFLSGCGLVCLVVYLPAGQLLSRVASSLVFRHDQKPFSTEDVALVNRSAFTRTPPRAGDVVLYDHPEVRVMGQTLHGQIAAFQLQGERVDRVLAGAGQTVRIEAGELSVDGVASPWRPLNAEIPMPSLDFAVPPQHCFIFPSSVTAAGSMSPNGAQWKQMSLVPQSQIRGRVYWQQWPWSKMGFIR